MQSLFVFFSEILRNCLNLKVKFVYFFHKSEVFSLLFRDKGIGILEGDFTFRLYCGIIYMLFFSFLNLFGNFQLVKI